MNNPLKIVTLCSGYDSQCLALEYLKDELPNFEYELVAWSEIDKNAILAHDLLFPQYADRNKGDMKCIDWSGIEDFDILFYSTPCQDFSISGYGKGGEEGSGTRSSLLWYTRNAVLAKMPKVLIMENVKNLLAYSHVDTFDKWIAELASYGYKTYYRVTNATDYGVPQDRNRIIAISFLMPDKRFRWPKPNKSYSLLDYIDDTWTDSEEANDFELFLLDSGQDALDLYTEFAIANGTKPLKDGGEVTFCSRPSNAANTLTCSTNRVTDCLLYGRRYPQTGLMRLRNGEVSLRGLSSRERYRLMGVRDKDIDKLLTISPSASPHVKLAGNSIVVDVLKHTFKEIITQDIQSLY